MLVMAGAFVLAPAMVAPLAIAAGPEMLAVFAAGCFALAAIPGRALPRALTGR